MNCKYALIVLILAIMVPDVLAQEYVVNSPDGQISATFDVKDGSLFYSVSHDGKSVVGSSRVEIFEDAKMMVDDHSVRENDSSWEPVWGQFSTIGDHHRELSLSMMADGIPVTLLCRVFDTGVGFRFVMSEESKGKEMIFFNEYKPLYAATHYSGQRGIEVSPQGETSYGAVPFVTKREDGLHVAFLESDLYSASGFELMKVQPLETERSFTASSSNVSNGEGQVTAWRTILIEETAGDLAVNTVALNLAAPNKLEDTSWIEPGKGLWDWRVHGYDNGEFVYGIDTRSYLRYIDFCAKHGIKYFTVDSGWYTSAKDSNMTVSSQVDIDKVMNYAEEKGVKILLYYDRHKGNFGDDALFSHYAGLGASGIKYGFMGNRAKFTRNAMEAAAENEILINFHDNPVPMAGVERTLPNLITREYCHAQQDYRDTFTPETFLRMAMVSTLSGPLDMSNGNFGINSINSGVREKGPREKNSYISTVVSEVARTLVIYSGLVTLPDAPEEYQEKSDLFEFLKVMPTTWDESRVLNSKIGNYITTARRSGDTWFVGSVNDRTERKLDVPLDFLDAAKTYEASIYQDAPDAHGLKKPEVYNITTKTVKRGNTITADMAFGGGHAMILRPVKD